MRATSLDPWLSVASAGLLLLAAPERPVGGLFGLVALVPLLFALDRAPPARAAALAGLCGFLVNALGMSWSTAVAQRFAGATGAWVWGAWALVSLYQAIPFALAGWAVAAARERLGARGWVVAPLAFAAALALWPALFFPWSLGVVLWRAWPLLQVAELGGACAVTAWLVLANAALLELALRRPGARAAAAWAVGLAALGLVRAAHVAWEREQAPALQVAALEPWAGARGVRERQRHGAPLLAGLVEATDRAGDAGAGLVVWPEAAFPYLVDRALGREVAAGHPWSLRGRYRGALLVGSLTHALGTPRLFNSALLFDSSGALRGLYDKRRLFPFGEYVPLAARFPGWAGRVRAALPEPPDVTSGSGSRLLEAGALKVLPFVCYEDVFPGGDAAAARGSNLLVSISNHGWFEGTAASVQAEALAVVQSVALRRDHVRATMSGRSSINDALGRVVAEGEAEPSGPVRTLQAGVRLLDVSAPAVAAVPYFPWVCLLVLALELARGATSARSRPSTACESTTLACAASTEVCRGPPR